MIWNRVDERERICLWSVCVLEQWYFIFKKLHCPIEIYSFIFWVLSRHWCHQSYCLHMAVCCIKPINNRQCDLLFILEIDFKWNYEMADIFVTVVYTVGKCNCQRCNLWRKTVTCQLITDEYNKYVWRSEIFTCISMIDNVLQSSCNSSVLL